MSLIKDVYQFSMIAFFMRRGDAFTLPAPGVADRESKPDGADPGYIDIGTIEKWEPKTSGTDQDVWVPTPGVLQLLDIRETKSRLTLSFTTGQVGPLAIETVFRALQNLDETSTQFNPGAGGLRRGWLHFDCYDQDTNEFRMNMDIWGRLKITGGMQAGDGTIIKPDWEFERMYSSLNTAGL
jgi:hypothetical protein